MISSRFIPAGTYSVPDALQAYRSPDLTSNVLTQSVVIDLRATLTTTGTATAQLNGGSLLGAVEEVQMIDNGEIVARFTGTELGAFTAHFGPFRASRLTSFAAGATALREQVVIPMAWAWPSSVVPTETGYRQRASDTKLQVAVKFKSLDAVGSIVVGSTTAVLSGITANVTQQADFSGIAPAAIPSVLSSQVTPIPGAVSALRIPLDTPDTIRAILLYGTTGNRGDVADIISRVSLRTDQAELIGPTGIPFATLVDAMAAGTPSVLGAFGGFSAVAGASTGGVYALIDFQRLGGGRLSQLLTKGAGTNLRFEIDASPSAVAGATGSGVRALIYALRRPAGLVSAEGAALLGG